ncbi:hypothetical protein BJY52DRAFT_1256160 [Lactarius psammicola]|nr:hypothetical protein BJY52DRAFT_1256160 [Lactarius psammicola]
MTANLPPTVRLNNYFQSIGRVWSISYLEKDNGPAADKRWSTIVKIDGVEMGSHSAARRAVAKEAAAEQALRRLRIS